MKKNCLTRIAFIFFWIFLNVNNTHTQEFHLPFIGEDVVFEEKDGIVAVEAEFFYRQTKNDVRQWYITTPVWLPDITPDPDPPHYTGASNNAYIEILPDTRVTHDDPLITGVNFSNTPGVLGIVHYKVHFNNPGRYYVWVRAYHTGSEDNGIHVGFNGNWPSSGRRLQWCNRNKWYWESKQRTDKEHCGEPYLIYLDIVNSGVHDIQFSMREDGFEMDKWLMTTDMSYNPRTDNVPPIRIKSGTFPNSMPWETQVYVNAPETMNHILGLNPNPASNLIWADFHIPGHRKVEIRLFNMSGSEISTLINQSMGPGRHKIPFDLSEMPEGLYFLRFQTEREIETRRFTIIH